MLCWYSRPFVSGLQSTFLVLSPSTWLSKARTSLRLDYHYNTIQIFMVQYICLFLPAHQECLSALALPHEGSTKSFNTLQGPTPSIPYPYLPKNLSFLLHIIIVWDTYTRCLVQCYGYVGVPSATNPEPLTGGNIHSAFLDPIIFSKGSN